MGLRTCIQTHTYIYLVDSLQNAYIKVPWHDIHWILILEHVKFPNITILQINIYLTKANFFKNPTPKNKIFIGFPYS